MEGAEGGSLKAPPARTTVAPTGGAAQRGPAVKDLFHQPDGSKWESPGSGMAGIRAAAMGGLGSSSTGGAMKKDMPQVKRWIPAISMRTDGTIGNTEISRIAISSELGCPLRDLRAVDPTFSGGQYPAILCRKEAVILSLSGVKAVIKKDEMLAFSPDHAQTRTLIATARHQLPSSGGVPFEQIALEACLQVVCQDLRTRAEAVLGPLGELMGGIKLGSSLAINLESLLPLKNNLDELLFCVKETTNCLNDVLSNDDDMARMYLTEGRREDEHEEVEMMLETYHMQLEMLAEDLREVQTMVKNTEDVVEINLDMLRNRIMKYDFFLNVAALSVTFGAMVTGVFGMNLVSHWEEYPNAFWSVTGGIYLFIMVSLALAFARLRSIDVL